MPDFELFIFPPAPVFPAGLLFGTLDGIVLDVVVVVGILYTENIDLLKFRNSTFKNQPLSLFTIGIGSVHSVDRSAAVVWLQFNVVIVHLLHASITLAIST